MKEKLTEGEKICRDLAAMNNGSSKEEQLNMLIKEYARKTAELYKMKAAIVGEDNALPYLEKSFSLNPNDHTIKEDLAKLYRQKQAERKVKKIHKSIYFNTLPKSGSIYLLRSLSHMFNISRKRIASGLFPNDVAYPVLIDDFYQGVWVGQEHLPATPRNLYNLSHYGIDRFIVHVRDPRQAVLSFVHHINKWQKRILKTVDIMLDDEIFFTLPLPQQIDWALTHLYPAMVSWIEGWVKVDEKNRWGITIKMMEFADMKKAPRSYFKEFCDFYKIEDCDLDKIVQQPRNEDCHFRKGHIDEWRHVFSSSQIDKVNLLLPDSLIKMFNWNY